MDHITITISSELFDDQTRQEASIRKNLPIRQLIEEIRREFNLLEGEYRLTLKGSSKPLEVDKTLEQLGLQTGGELVFERERMRLSQQLVARGSKPAFQPIAGPAHAFLREEDTGREYDIEWQPAIIGRADASHTNSLQRVAVDLNDMAEARTVSRQHARITERAGQYFIEAASERNPTILNEREIGQGQKATLKPGDQIRVGKIVLIFGLRP
jgi:hypothetical protein